MPVTAAITVGLTVEYVRPAVRTNPNCLYWRPIFGIDRIPPGPVVSRISRVSLIRSATVRRPEHLVVLLATPRLRRFSLARGYVAARGAGPGILLRPNVSRVKVVVRPV
jgi:hypothetical protein